MTPTSARGAGRLSDALRDGREHILAEWERAVRESESASASMSSEDLRDDMPRFIDRLVALWDEGAYPFGYARFVADLEALLPGPSRPRLVVSGVPDPAFEKQRPFTVSPPPPLALESLVEELAEAIRTQHPVIVSYRNEPGNESSLTFTPRLLGTSGGEWRVLGVGANQFYCLHLERVVALERGPALPSSKAALITRDHYPHCIQVVDVWAAAAPGNG